MTNSKRHHNDPTPRQLGLLRKLAEERGMTFAVPRTFAEADREINTLLKVKRTSSAERRRETRQVRRDMSTRRGDGATVRIDEETGGYGSSAHWS